jgi:hypothetical protein
MDTNRLGKAARPKSLGAYLAKIASRPHHDHGGQVTSTRMAEHRGHQIALETIYRVKVDGKLAKIPLMVDDTGAVHCHSLPNYQFDSAMDMIKAIIDLFPDSFGAKRQDTHHAHHGSRSSRSKKPARRRRK